LSFVDFTRQRLGFDPNPLQELVLRGGRRGIVNCTRQSGKSTVSAAKAVHRAYCRSRIVGLPHNEATARGFSKVNLMLIDEASRVGDDLYRAMRPVLAVGNGDLWLMSTPNGKRGFFHAEWTEGGEQWQRISATAMECPWIDAEFLADERKNTTRLMHMSSLAALALRTCRIGGGVITSPMCLRALLSRMAISVAECSPRDFLRTDILRRHSCPRKIRLSITGRR
jgi:hypothetical protein